MLPTALNISYILFFQAKWKKLSEMGVQAAAPYILSVYWHRVPAMSGHGEKFSV